MLKIYFHLIKLKNELAIPICRRCIVHALKPDVEHERLSPCIIGRLWPSSTRETDQPSGNDSLSIRNEPWHQGETPSKNKSSNYLKRGCRCSVVFLQASLLQSERKEAMRAHSSTSSRNALPCQSSRVKGIINVPRWSKRNPTRHVFPVNQIRVVFREDMIISAQCPACNETSGSFSVATNKFFPSYLCVFSFWFYAYIYSIMYNCLAPKLSLNRTMPTKGPIWTRSTIPCSRSSSLRFYHPLKKKKKENIQIGPRVVSKQRESVSTLEVPLALFRNVHASI